MARAHFRDTAVGVDTGGVQRSLVGATVNVYVPGTTTPIAQTMYNADSAGSVLANPLTSGAGGMIDFYLDTDERVDLYITMTGYSPQRVTVDVTAQATLTSPAISDPTLTGTVVGTPAWASTQAMNISGAAAAAASGTLTGATLAANVLASSLTSLGTLTALTVSGTLTLTAAASKIVPGVTSLSLRNNADSADNLLISDAGAATIRAGLTVTASGVRISAGNLGVGVAASTDIGVYVGGTPLTSGSNQYAFYTNMTFGAGATTSMNGIRLAVATPAAAIAVLDGRGVWVRTPTIGATSALTTNRGAHVENQGAAGVTNAIGVDIDAQSGAATLNIGLRNSGSTSLIGNLGFYGTAPIAKQTVTGSRGANAALASLLTALAAHGLLTDSSS